MATLQVNGRKAYYQNGGVEWQSERTVLIFIHGTGMDHTVWQQQSRALAHHGVNVAALDLPGHGGSEAQPGLETMGGYCDWVLAFMDAAGLERAVLVGQSLGGSIALELAATHPGRVRALVLIGVGLEMTVNPALLDDSLNHKARAEKFITAFTHGIPIHLGGAPTPGNWMLGSAMALLHASTPEVLHRDFLVCDQWDGHAFAPQVTCPTLVVNGDKDRMTPLRAVKILAETVSGARLEVLGGIGHMVQTEAPRQLLKLMEGFLAGLE